MRIVPLLTIGLLVAGSVRAQTPTIDGATPEVVRIEAGKRAEVVLHGTLLGSLEGAAVLQGRERVPSIRATLASGGRDFARRGVTIEVRPDAVPAAGLDLVVSYTDRFRRRVRIGTPVHVEVVRLPDLRSAGCSFGTELVASSETGSKLIVRILVENVGTGSAIWPSTSRTGLVDAFLIRSPLGWDAFPGRVPTGTVIEPGRRRTVRAEIPLYLLEPGVEYRVSGEIDPARRVEESDEADNRFDCPPFGSGS